MTKEWEDIRVTDDIDTPSSHGDPVHTGLTDVHLVLSDDPPPGWAQCFEALWRKRIYVKRDAAHISGNHLVVKCVLSELQTVHMPHLKEVIEATNRAYRDADKIRIRQETSAQEAAARRREEIDEVRKKLRSDLEGGNS